MSGLLNLHYHIVYKALARLLVDVQMTMTVDVAWHLLFLDGRNGSTAHSSAGAAIGCQSNVVKNGTPVHDIQGE